MLGEYLSQISLNENLALVAPALLVLGYVLKQTPHCPDWFIIWVLLCVGIASGVLTIGATVDGVANGIIAAGMAITTHQAVKQTVKRE